MKVLNQPWTQREDLWKVDWLCMPRSGGRCTKRNYIRAHTDTHTRQYTQKIETYVENTRTYTVHLGAQNNTRIHTRAHTYTERHPITRKSTKPEPKEKLSERGTGFVRPIRGRRTKRKCTRAHTDTYTHIRIHRQIPMYNSDAWMLGVLGCSDSVYTLEIIAHFS